MKKLGQLLENFDEAKAKGLVDSLGKIQQKLNEANEELKAAEQALGTLGLTESTKEMGDLINKLHTNLDGIVVDISNKL